MKRLEVVFFFGEFGNLANFLLNEKKEEVIIRDFHHILK